MPPRSTLAAAALRSKRAFLPRNPPIQGPAVATTALARTTAPSTLRAPRPRRPLPKKTAGHGAAALVALESLAKNPLVWLVGAAAGIWFYEQKKKAPTPIVSGGTYRFVTAISPPITDPNVLARLTEEIESDGNREVRVTSDQASYEVDRSTSMNLAPGQVLADFEGSRVILKSVSRVA